MSFQVGVNRGSGGGGESGLWTPTISNVRPNGLTSDSGTITLYSSTWKKIGNFVEIYIMWQYTPVTSVIPTVLNFNFTFPTQFAVQDFYGETFLFYTANGPVVGAGGGGILAALPGEIQAPYMGAIANTGVGPYPTQVRSNSAIIGSVKGILYL